VEQNREPGKNPHSYSQLFLKKASKTYNGEKTASSTNVSGKCGYLSAKY
jgi:hypothetical protein